MLNTTVFMAQYARTNSKQNCEKKLATYMTKSSFFNIQRT